MFWNRPVDSALHRLKQSVHAPLRVVLWDGREVALSEAPRVTLRVRGTRGAAAFQNPSLLSLAEAYIAGDVDLEGDMREAIRSAEAITRSRDDALYGASGPTRARHTRSVDRQACLLYTSPSPRDLSTSRMPSSA